LISSPHGIGALSSPSSASPTLASIPTDSVSADSPSSADSPILEAASSSSSHAGLQLMVDLSSYQLPPSSPVSPPARSSHLMTLRPRQQTWLLLLPPPLPPHGYCILLLVNTLHFLMLTGMQFGIMLSVMRSLFCAQIALGLWFRFILL